jgi:UDP-hydrolysing UDP-N-acetyl-D-glucosamine 2-epimerase
MSSKRILAFTGIRSDYDLMSYIYKSVDSDPRFHLRLLCYGAHLLPKYGLSIKGIEADGLEIFAKISNLSENDSPSERLVAAGKLMLEAVPLISKNTPDMILYAGDREDALIAAEISGYLRIPGIHFFGGDHATDGNIDNPVRHAISKLSTYHFVSAEQHKTRLLKMGEPESRISVCGSPSLDKLLSEPALTKNELSKVFLKEGSAWPMKTALFTYHPMYGEEPVAGVHVTAAIQALLARNYFVFCNSPNIDAGNSKIFKAIAAFQNRPDVAVFKNASRTHFVNLMRHVDLIAGNSSAGVIEAATLKKPVINIGNRQFGRLAGQNVVFCKNDVTSIHLALETVESPAFTASFKNLTNPYGDGKSVPRIVERLHSMNFYNILEKKEDPL